MRLRFVYETMEESADKWPHAEFDTYGAPFVLGPILKNKEWVLARLAKVEEIEEGGANEPTTPQEGPPR